jgi:Fic family protein
MVAIVTKRIKGNEYLYLVTSIRKGEKVIQKTIKYIGKKRPISKSEFECMKYSYENRDWILSDMEDFLSYTDHSLLLETSKKVKEYKKHIHKYSDDILEKEFLSTFIASTNAIEGSTLTKEQTYNYLFEDIVPAGRSKKELYMAENILTAWNYCKDNCSRFPNQNDLKILHSMVNKGIESEKTLGKYKPIQNYVGDIYTTSFLFTDKKIEQLLRWIRKAKRKMNEFEIIFQSHAQFEIIHPFLDGNGRVGRLLINWLLIYYGLEPMIIRNTKRDQYISALLNAQRGKTEAICTFLRDEYLYLGKKFL